jgi:hypothetical protein
MTHEERLKRLTENYGKKFQSKETKKELGTLVGISIDGTEAIFDSGYWIDWNKIEPLIEPRVWWVNEYNNGGIGDMYESEQEAKEHAVRDYFRTIELMEVIK